MANLAIEQVDDRPSLEAMTHRCTHRRHREFILHFDDGRTALADVRRVAEELEAAVSAGERFAAGDVVRVGWVPLRVVETADALVLIEPDFKSIPIRYVPGVDSAIAHLRAQDELAARVGLPITRPSLDHTARVCPHVTDESGAVLDRSAPQGTDSGWLVGCASDACDRHDLELRSLYEVVCRHPSLVEFLALPAGCTVASTMLSREAIVWLHGHELGHRGDETFVARSSRVGRNTPLARCGTIR